MSTVHRLPGPVTDRWEWQGRGACRGRDSAQFFHPDGERGSSRARREEAAKLVCASCPVRPECAAHALLVREPYGVWGGFTETERERIHERGWEDLVDRRRGRADIRALEERLRRTDRELTVPATVPAPHQLTARRPHPREPADAAPGPTDGLADLDLHRVPAGGAVRRG